MPIVHRKVLAAVALIAAAMSLAACSRQPAAPEPVRAVRTQVISGGEAATTLEFAGEVRARVESNLGFRVGGKMVARLVNLGDTVHAGQVLARLDPSDYLLAEQAAKAGVQSARVNRDMLAADYKRFIDLYDKGFISIAQLQQHETAFKAAQAQLDQARAQEDVQRNQAGYAQLVADAPGVVTSVMVDPGTVVAAGTPIVRVAQDGPRDVIFSVPEDKLAGVRAASSQPDALKLRLWGSQELQPIKLREVAGATDPLTRTFQFKADLGKIEARPGRTATVVLAMPKVEQIVKLPLAAVLEQQGKTSVWVLDPKTMKVQAQPVMVGGAEGNLVVIAGGLQPGQEVVVAGVHVLTAGQQVTRYVDPLASGLKQ